MENNNNNYPSIWIQDTPKHPTFKYYQEYIGVANNNMRPTQGRNYKKRKWTTEFPRVVITKTTKRNYYDGLPHFITPEKVTKTDDSIPETISFSSQSSTNHASVVSNEEPAPLTPTKKMKSYPINDDAKGMRKKTFSTPIPSGLHPMNSGNPYNNENHTFICKTRQHLQTLEEQLRKQNENLAILLQNQQRAANIDLPFVPEDFIKPKSFMSNDDNTNVIPCVGMNQSYKTNQMNSFTSDSFDQEGADSGSSMVRDEFDFDDCCSIKTFKTCMTLRANAIDALNDKSFDNDFDSLVAEDFFEDEPEIIPIFEERNLPDRHDNDQEEGTVEGRIKRLSLPFSYISQSERTFNKRQSLCRFLRS